MEKWLRLAIHDEDIPEHPVKLTGIEEQGPICGEDPVLKDQRDVEILGRELPSGCPTGYQTFFERVGEQIKPCQSHVDVAARHFMEVVVVPLGGSKIVGVLLPLPSLRVEIERGDVRIAEVSESTRMDKPIGVHGRAVRFGALMATVIVNDGVDIRSEEHTSELQSRSDLVCRLLLEKKKKKMSTPLNPTRPPPALCAALHLSQPSHTPVPPLPPRCP